MTTDSGNVMILCVLAAMLLVIQPGVLSAETSQAPAVIRGQTLYVDDNLWITVREAPDPNSERLAVIQSGTAMTLLQHEENADYAEVRLESGKTGWVLFRYVTAEPTAALELERLSKEYDDLKKRHDSNQESLQAIKKERSDTSQQNQQMQQTIDKLQQELDTIKQVSSDAISNFNEKKRLEQEAAALQSRLNQLTSENESLRSNLYLYSAIAGIGGLVLGLYIGTAPIRRDKRWRKMP